MRLIDADELKKDDEVTMWLSNDAIRTGKQLKMFSELFINKIDNMPTVQAVPIEVLDKIRAEIWDLQYGDEEKSMTDEDRAEAYNNAIIQAIEIIDKYRGEA